MRANFWLKDTTTDAHLEHRFVHHPSCFLYLVLVPPWWTKYDITQLHRSKKSQCPLTKHQSTTTTKKRAKQHKTTHPCWFTKSPRTYPYSQRHWRLSQGCTRHSCRVNRRCAHQVHRRFQNPPCSPKKRPTPSENKTSFWVEVRSTRKTLVIEDSMKVCVAVFSSSTCVAGVFSRVCSLTVLWT